MFSGGRERVHWERMGSRKGNAKCHGNTSIKNHMLCKQQRVTSWEKSGKIAKTTSNYILTLFNQDARFQTCILQGFFQKNFWKVVCWSCLIHLTFFLVLELDKKIIISDTKTTKYKLEFCMKSDFFFLINFHR